MCTWREVRHFAWHRLWKVIRSRCGDAEIDSSWERGVCVFDAGVGQPGQPLERRPQIREAQVSLAIARNQTARLPVTLCRLRHVRIEVQVPLTISFALSFEIAPQGLQRRRWQVCNRTLQSYAPAERVKLVMFRLFVLDLCLQVSSVAHGQARRQDFAAGGQKSRRGAHFKIKYIGCMQQPGTKHERVAGHHCPPRWRRSWPCSVRQRSQEFCSGGVSQWRRLESECYFRLFSNIWNLIWSMKCQRKILASLFRGEVCPLRPHSGCATGSVGTLVTLSRWHLSSIE